MLTMLTNFFITQLIWSITVGLPHTTTNIVLLFLLLKLWDHLKTFHALILSLVLNLGAFLLFISMTYGIFVWGLNSAYVMPKNAYQGYNDFLTTSLALAGIYIVLQSIILVIINQYKRFNIWRAFICIVCSNLVTALLIYKLALIKYK